MGEPTEDFASPIKQVGLIGLGIMGLPMARNLVKAGFDVTVYSRTQAKVAALEKEGARGASGPAELASRCQMVITMVPDSSDVESVAEGKGGIFEGAKPGLIIADMSTISPLTTRRLSAAAAERRFLWLDAPVSGGQAGAIAGTMTIMVGGERAAFERAQPVFAAMGQRITYMGASGQGQTAKLCNQILVAVNLLAVSEALVFGAKAGLDLDSLLDALTAGAANSWALDNLGRKMLKRDFAPAFMVRLQQKDLRLVGEAARELQVPVIGAGLVHQLLTSLEAAGRGDDGTQALVNVLESLAGVEVTGKGSKQ
ncbi:MAG: NAD(P)-dependent oxidoreductase [Pyrinomonadaceae bacterium]|nr:NAD(P)-dependent oxidoreductase [Pyrinomonadaceae bacterium]